MVDKKINDKQIIIFEDMPVRRVWIKKQQKWYFSVVDVIRILTNSPTPRQYWSKIKDREFKELQLSPIWVQLKLKSVDNKKYLTDCADVKGIFRIIQSIPSKKAEPFKQWLAKVGYERLQETVDPEIAINRARKNWKKYGMPEKWIEQRMRGQEIRNKLTDYWSENEVKKEIEYAKLTDIIHQEWSELTTEQHKKLKKLKHENLRNNMTETELLFTALAELSTTKIAKKEKAKGYNENAISAKRGGGIAKNARQQLEKVIGEKVVSPKNNLLPKQKIKKLFNEINNK